MATGAANGPSPTTDGRRFDAVIPSDFVQGRQLQNQILAEVERRGYNESCLFAVKLALEEALVNAIRHGNKQDPSKEVRIEATVSDESVVIVIRDQGPGFDRAAVPDPTAEENLEKCSGRGILLIEAYMDEAEWTDRGRCLRMVKKRSA